MNISEKAAYIKGLAEGLKLDENDAVQKVLLAVVDALGDIASEVEDNAADILDISDQVDAVDEDLAELEQVVYDEFDDDDDVSDDEFYQVTCPKCGTDIYLDEDTIAEDGIACPECGTELTFDFDADSDDENSESEE